jgi:hypothetical protein
LTCTVLGIPASGERPKSCANAKHPEPRGEQRGIGFRKSVGAPSDLDARRCIHRLSGGLIENTEHIGECYRLRTPPRILVVDDDPTSLEVLRAPLSALGYEVVIAVDAAHARRPNECFPHDLARKNAS